MSIVNSCESVGISCVSKSFLTFLGYLLSNNLRCQLSGRVSPYTKLLCHFFPISPFSRSQISDWNAFSLLGQYWAVHIVLTYGHNNPLLFFITQICREIRQAGGKGLGLPYPEDGGKNDGINIEWLTDGKSKLLLTFYINIPKRNEFSFRFAKSSNTDRVQTLVKLIRGLFLEKPGKPFCVCRVYIIIIIINFIYIASISLTVLGAYIQDQSFSFKKFWN